METRLNIVDDTSVTITPKEDIKISTNINELADDISVVINESQTFDVTIKNEDIINARIAGQTSFDDIDPITLKIKNGKLSVNTTDLAEHGNNQPITSCGVEAIVGNINALLELI